MLKQHTAWKGEERDISVCVWRLHVLRWKIYLGWERKKGVKDVRELPLLTMDPVLPKSNNSNHTAIDHGSCWLLLKSAGCTRSQGYVGKRIWGQLISSPGKKGQHPSDSAYGHQHSCRKLPALLHLLCSLNCCRFKHKENVSIISTKYLFFLGFVF